MTEAAQQSRAASRSQASHSGSADDEIDLGYLLAICLDNRWLIIGVTLLVTLLGAAYAWLATPEYRADALLQVEQRANNLGSLDMALLGQETTQSTTQSEILRSRMIMGQAAQQAGLDLVVRPNYFPVIGAALVRRGTERPGWAQGGPHAWAGDSINVGELLIEQALQGQPLTLKVTGPTSYTLSNQDGEQLGNGQVGEWLRLDQPYVELLVERIAAPNDVEFTLIKRSETQMIRYLQSRFAVNQRGRDTGILELTLTGPNPQEIQRSLNAIADVYLVQNINRQAAEAESRLEFLEQQTPLIQDDLNSAESRLNDYRATQDSVDLDFETRSMLERLVELEGELNALQIQESELAQRFTPSHPSYQALIEKRRQLVGERNRLEQQVDTLPETQRQVLRLNRDVEVSQQIYMQMLNATQELRIARAGTVGNVRILDNALVSNNPIAPRTNLIIVISLMAGLMLGLMVVLVRHMLHRGVTSVEELQALGLQVYATVPLSEKQQKLFDRFTAHKTRKRFSRVLGKHLGDKVSGPLSRRRHSRSEGGVLAVLDPSDLAIEALRSLRTSLHFAMLEANNNRLMLTGPSPAVGKSFISTNLAAICAQGGQRVLLIDADMRKGHIHRSFNGVSEQGLSDFLVGDTPRDQVIRHTELETLDYIARGTAPPNPSELLMTKRFSEFLDSVGQEYDLVIIDTPPALAVTDAAVVGKQVGATLMITRFRENNPKEIERALQQLESAGVIVKGCILNAIERSASAYYGYGYGYGYYHYAYKSDDQ
ncbi:polysaccharide biosynthesis tyrosine autokinase [Pseudohongiella sp. SYSU M77423]|uniref:polysaccharide biosynthesis tyrosine autokinase n=1 Tax=Pseudohongiella sp. SYSU M77423 TaxID=3042312 RepID=UPI00247FE86C|nr:polysaccharide biosynthesis tyrosine autokinase [Pseudohongiella sp. SYSU M77423]MDH7944944.1 polysaccharide biosynthesis tyrosine autokinase [Pseudohongiella sp. SYSU M77423]